MRQMFSKNQIKEIVNQGIEDGSIHADPSTEVKVADINSESATAGKVITANGEGGATWESIPSELPAIASGDSGKVLKVNDGESGVEWGSVSGGLSFESINIAGAESHATTMQDLYDVTGDVTDKLVEIKYRKASYAGPSILRCQLSISSRSGGGGSAKIIFLFPDISSTNIIFGAYSSDSPQLSSTITQFINSYGLASAKV